MLLGAVVIAIVSFMELFSIAKVGVHASAYHESTTLRQRVVVTWCRCVAGVCREQGLRSGRVARDGCAGRRQRHGRRVPSIPPRRIVRAHRGVCGRRCVRRAATAFATLLSSKLCGDNMAPRSCSRMCMSLAGTRSLVCNFLVGCCMLLVLGSLSQLFYYIPMALLAAIIITAVVSLFKVGIALPVHLCAVTASHDVDASAPAAVRAAG